MGIQSPPTPAIDSPWIAGRFPFPRGWAPGQTGGCGSPWVLDLEPCERGATGSIVKGVMGFSRDGSDREIFGPYVDDAVLEARAEFTKHQGRRPGKRWMQDFLVKPATQRLAFMAGPPRLWASTPPHHSRRFPGVAMEGKKAFLSGPG